MVFTVAFRSYITMSIIIQTYVERINSGFFVKIVCQMNTDLIYLTKKNISTYADHDKFE